MKFPDMTTTTINVPNSLLEKIDAYAEHHLLNRSACIRILTAKGLKDGTENLAPNKPVGCQELQHTKHQEIINIGAIRQTKES